MKETIICIIILFHSINSFCHNNQAKTINIENDSIAEGQLITEINITEKGDTVYSYRYNIFDYGDLSNNNSGMRNTNVKSSPTIMSITGFN